MAPPVARGPRAAAANPVLEVLGRGRESSVLSSGRSRAWASGVKERRDTIRLREPHDPGDKGLTAGWPSHGDTVCAPGRVEQTRGVSALQPGPPCRHAVTRGGTDSQRAKPAALKTPAACGGKVSESSSEEWGRDWAHRTDLRVSEDVPTITRCRGQEQRAEPGPAGSGSDSASCLGPGQVPLLAVSLVPRTVWPVMFAESPWLLGIASVQGWAAPCGSDHRTRPVSSPERTANAGAKTFSPARLQLEAPAAPGR